MKFNKFCFFATPVLFLCQSCDEKAKNVEPVDHGVEITVDASLIEDSADVSAILKKIEIIPLKQKEGDYIAEVWKVIFTNNFYIVFDRYVTKRIHVYNSRGGLYKSIIPTGAGPNEVMQITDCWINENGHLEVYDFSLNRILVFDGDFNPKGSFKGKDHLFLNAVQSVGDKYLGFGGYNNYNKPFRNKHYKIAILDSLFEMEETAFHFDERFRGALISTPTDPFGRIGSEYIFSQDYDNVIYNITESGGFTARYRLDYLPNPIPSNFNDKVIGPQLDLFKADDVEFENIDRLYRGYSGFRGKWLESSDYSIFYSFDENYENFVSIYDKADQNILAQAKHLYDRKNKLIIPYLNTVNPSENCFISVLEGYAMANFIKEDSLFQELVIDGESEGYFLVKVYL